jgi:transposase
MHVQTILNRLQKQPGFVYGEAALVARGSGGFDLNVRLHARKGSKGVCSKCMKRRPGYDHLPERMFQFVPFWGMAVFFLYAPRRVDCPECGVTVELLPWAEGKHRLTTTFVWFLASWAKVLCWKDVADRFQTSWQTVFRAVGDAVLWGLRHRNLEAIRSIGVDEFAWKKGHKYLTLIYQIDHGCKRLLWMGRDRTAATFNAFFDWLGKERSSQIEFIASDMWKAFIGVIARKASSAVHVLDRFHVAKMLGDAVDKVRRAEVRSLRQAGRPAFLTKTRWILLRRHSNRSRSERTVLQDLVRLNLRSARACLLKEHFDRFWSYLTPHWGGRFLDRWCTMAMRSRLEPVQKVARSLRKHRPLLLNWFRARRAFSHGATEGLNNKARSVTKRSYGFRSYLHAQVALYHAMGKLPEPEWLTHRFW